MRYIHSLIVVLLIFNCCHGQASDLTDFRKMLSIRQLEYKRNGSHSWIIYNLSMEMNQYLKGVNQDTLLNNLVNILIERNDSTDWNAAILLSSMFHHAGNYSYNLQKIKLWREKYRSKEILYWVEKRKEILNGESK